MNNICKSSPTVFFLLVISVFLSCRTGKQASNVNNQSAYSEQKGYIISANIKDLPDGTVFYLIRSNERGKADTVTKVKSLNGYFSMRGALQETPEMHFIKMDTSVTKITSKAKTWTPILLENESVSITGELKNWPIVTLDGSSATIDYIRVGEILRTKINESNNKVATASKEIPKDSLKIAILARELIQDLVTTLKSHPDTYATPLLAANITQIDARNNEEIYNGLSERVKSSLYGIRLKNNFISLYKSQQIIPGAIMPAFSLLSPNGKDMNILEELAKSKITLIDFWASWCQPCRKEVPNLLKVYNAFHKDGFNIIAISSDAKKEAWEKAMAEDNTPWVHGLEKTSFRIGKEFFRLESIPAYALVDGNGKLLAFERGLSTVKAFGPDIRGEELYATIEKLLQEMEKGSNNKASATK